MSTIRMSHRTYLRVLSARNRRAWAEQRARLKPRVPIATAPSDVVSPFAITICRSSNPARGAFNRFLSRICIFS